MRLRYLMPKLALALFSVVFVLVVAEGAARLAWNPRPLKSYGSNRGPLTVADLRKPNTRGVFGYDPYRNNSKGFRGPEYPLRKDLGVFRIIVSGDSVTMGWSVAEEAAYPSRTQSLLNTADDDQTYEVLNLGLAQLNLRQIVDRLEEVGLQFNPDLIVYGFSLNDVMSKGYRFSHVSDVTRRLRLESGEVKASRSYLLRILAPPWRSLREILFPGPGSLVWELDDNFFHNREVWELFSSGLGRLAKIGSERDICIAAFIHTDLHHLHFLHPFRRFYDRVADSAKGHGLHVIESLPEFIGRQPRELWLGETDRHPNSEGHRLLANALFNGLRALPAECWVAGATGMGGFSDASQ